MTIGFLIARQRSGTGALGTVLDQHPQVAYLGEVFHDDAVNRPPNYFAFIRSQLETNPKAFLPSEAPNNFDKYLESVESQRTKDISIIDVKYNSVHHINSTWYTNSSTPVLILKILRKNLPVIHLIRANLLRTFLSGKLADLNRIYHTSDVTMIRHHHVKLCPIELKAYINEAEEETTAIGKYLAGYERMICLEYSMVFDGHGKLSASAARELEQFLGIDTIVTRMPVFVKQATASLKESIENYDEIHNMLIKTPHSWMLFAP
jgi:hypothetical protein